MGCGDSSLANANYSHSEPPNDLDNFLNGINGIQAGATPACNPPQNVLEEIHPQQMNQLKPSSKQKNRKSVPNINAQIKHQNILNKQNHEVENSSMEQKKMGNIEKPKSIENIQIVQNEQKLKNIEAEQQCTPKIQEIEKKHEEPQENQIANQQLIKQNQVQIEHQNNIIQNQPATKIQPTKKQNKRNQQNMVQNVNDHALAQKKNLQNLQSYRSGTDSVVIRQQIKSNQEQLANRLAERLKNIEEN